MQNAFALTLSSDPDDIAEIAAVVALGLAILALLGSGVAARRRSKRVSRGTAKGNLRLLSGGALVLLLGFVLFPPALADDTDPAASATPSLTPTPESTDPGSRFESCDEAKVESRRLYDLLLQRGADGDVAGMTSTAETQLQTVVLNEDCFSERAATAVSEVVQGLRYDPLPPIAAEKFSVECRAVSHNVLRLFNIAALRKAAGDERAADKLSGGFARIGARNPVCLPSESVADFEDQLEAAPSNGTTTATP